MKVGDFEVGTRVSYVPMHARGDLGHPDVEHGVVSSTNDRYVFVRFAAEVGAKACRPEDLRLQFRA